MIVTVGIHLQSMKNILCAGKTSVKFDKERPHVFLPVLTYSKLLKTHEVKFELLGPLRSKEIA